MLLALLHDWTTSLDHTELIDFFFTTANTSLYDSLLTLPPSLSHTTLYLLRFGLSLFTFHSQRMKDFSYAKLITVILSTLPVSHLSSDGHYQNTAVLSQRIAELLQLIAIRPRESFLPEDPLEDAINQVKVLLYSGIPAVHTAKVHYEYTLENLHLLEQTAFKMFQFGLLPEKNTYGYSVHSLPSPLVNKIPLFRPEGMFYAKRVTSRVYAVTNVWISPFLGQLIVAVKDWPCVTIPVTSIQVRF